MRLLRAAFVSAALLAAPLSVGVLAPHDAHASVMIAVPFESLVKDADAVAVVVPQEATSVWENGRIYTYTKVKVEQGVAGDLATGSEGVVRTMGGVVDKIGQLVDGEPVLTPGRPALLFMRKFKTGGTWEVSARAQGQYPVVVDDAKKTKRIVRSANVGVLLPPKNLPTQVAGQAGQAVEPQSQAAAGAAKSEVTNVRLAQEVLHDRPLDEVTKEISATWKRLHTQPGPVSK